MKERGQGFTIGIGLTNRCNTSCPHCYSRPTLESTDIDFASVLKLLTSIPVKNINFGTGESILYPRFPELIERIHDLPIPFSLTTNGSTVAKLSDRQLGYFHDIDFSLDFPDEKSNDSWRGGSHFAEVIEGIRRCKDLGIEACIAMCLMKTNYDKMVPMLELMNHLEVCIRINIYKAVNSEQFNLTYREFWSAMRDLTNNAFFISCSEPIVNAALGKSNGHRGHPCGDWSFRIKPEGKIVACVYLNNSDIYVDDVLKNSEIAHAKIRKSIELPLPVLCRECVYVETCNGGCASRRLLKNPQEPDEFCFIKQGERLELKARWKNGKDFVHEDYLCTMIFSV
jgi:radical SAM protein with 4Fe4S-binding SPASM domain